MAASGALRAYGRGGPARELTAAEQHIDVEGLTDELETAKEELVEAIAAEQARVARALAEGRGRARLELTEAMVDVILRLHEAGREHAQREMRSMGVEPRRAMATAGQAPAPVQPVLVRFRALLGGQQLRLERALLRESLTSGSDVFGAIGLARQRITERLEEVPGVRDAASQLVSQSLTSGLNDVYAANEDLFGGWQYSAVLDGGTCDVCRPLDGRVYDTLAEMYEDLPDFGPNPRCLGGYRCRCRGVPLPPEVAPAGPPPPDPLAPTGPDPLPIHRRREARLEELEAWRREAAWEDMTGGMQNDAELDARWADLQPQGGRDPALARLFEAQGFDGLPHVLDEADLDRFVEEGERELWRGMAVGDVRWRREADLRREAGQPLPPLPEGQDFAEQFRSGRYHPGTGVNGNGTYTAYQAAGRGLAPEQVASDYARGGQVIRMTLKADARVIRVSEAYDRQWEDIAAVRKRIDQANVQLNEAQLGPDYDRALEHWSALVMEHQLLEDVGRWAVIRGYDALDVDDVGHVVVLNRTAVRVSTRTWEPHEATVRIRERREREGG